MAIAKDTSTNGGEQTGSSSTWSHTCTGSNLVLIVGVSIGNATTTVSSVTYNGVNLTAAGSISQGNGKGAQLWYLAGPATGANDVVVTLSGATNHVGGATSYTGVDQTTPVDGYVTNTGFSTTPTVDVTSQTNDMVVDCVASLTDDTVGAGQTQDWMVYQITFAGASSHEDGAATVTMSWTQSTNNGWANAALNMNVAGAGSGSNIVNLLPVLGVGQAK